MKPTTKRIWTDIANQSSVPNNQSGLITTLGPILVPSPSHACILLLGQQLFEMLRFPSWMGTLKTLGEQEEEGGEDNSNPGDDGDLLLVLDLPESAPLGWFPLTLSLIHFYHPVVSVGGRGRLL